MTNPHIETIRDEIDAVARISEAVVRWNDADGGYLYSRDTIACRLDTVRRNLAAAAAALEGRDE
jgi:hypothetical protein